MKTLDYFALDGNARNHWRDAIAAQEWSAASFLAKILREGRFFQMFGDDARLLLAVDGDRLMGFCTYAHQDEIPAPELFPWIGFVFVAPEYRGARLAGRLIDCACDLASADGHRRVYISTGHVGLYEKHGFTYWKDMPDSQGNPCRVYFRDLLQP